MISFQQTGKIFAYFSTGKKYIPIPNRVTLKKFANVSVYKRKEPGIGINFISEKSKILLGECLKENTANTFFELIDQFQTQSDPSYCGPTNLMTVLNTLNVDPKAKWKGIWRWYDEEMIKCLNIERIKDFGMTLGEFSIILNCNGVKSKVYRLNGNSEENKSISIDNMKIETEDLGKNDYSCINHFQSCKNLSKKFVNFSYIDYSFFQAAALASTKWNKFFLMCNLGRGGLKQTGDGHFTPIAAFHQKENLGLLLESARFKYNSRWFNIEDIYNSLTEKDKLSDLSRGFLLINKNNQSIVPIETDNIPLSKLKESYGLITKCPQYNFLTMDNKAFLLNYFMTNKIKPLEKHVIKDDIIQTLTQFNSDSKTFKSLVHFMYQFDNVNIIYNLLHILTNPSKTLFKRVL